MSRGRPTRLTVRLTPAERLTLEAWQRTTSLPAGLGRRGRLLLLLDAGMRITWVAEAVGISRRFVYKWVARFEAHGLEGLYDLPRRAEGGRPTREQTTMGKHWTLKGGHTMVPDILPARRPCPQDPRATPFDRAAAWLLSGTLVLEVTHCACDSAAPRPRCARCECLMAISAAALHFARLEDSLCPF